jgi:hypothetical protein
MLVAQIVKRVPIPRHFLKLLRILKKLWQLQESNIFFHNSNLEHIQANMTRLVKHHTNPAAKP